jgi:tRNA modification GTPase
VLGLGGYRRIQKRLRDTTTVSNAVQGADNRIKTLSNGEHWIIRSDCKRGTPLTMTMEGNDTIAAISTPAGVGAIAVVRLSGPLACQIIQSAFVPTTAKKAQRDESESWLRTHRAVHGYFIEPKDGQRIDEVVVTAFLAPHSYTAEDLVEIASHGSPVVSRKILDVLTSQGARLAKPGEFTQRAFLAGRVDLTQAEAVLDLIQAKTIRQSRVVLSALSGDVGREIRSTRDQLMKLLSEVVAGIDFPDEVGETPDKHIESALNDCQAKLVALVKTARSGKYLRDGLRLAIVGRPNVGKSSLLNRLLNVERAIVTEIPGTTRDAIEEWTEVNGIPILLIDTAGIRQTKDKVEVIGIERTKRAVSEADLLLFMVDLLSGWACEEDEITSLIADKPMIILCNKSDLVPNGSCQSVRGESNGHNVVEQLLISAKTGEGMAQLSQAIERWALSDFTNSDCAVSLNDRQASLCYRAIEALKAAQATYTNRMPQDCLAVDLKTAIDMLSEVCGELVSEEVITEVFARFCIGK